MIDYTNKDYEAFRNFMLEQLGILMPEYTDRSETDAGIVLLELLAKGLDIISFYQDVIANEAFLVTEEQRANALKWCNMLGYAPKNAVPAKVKQVFFLSEIQDTPVIIPAGTRIKTDEDISENAVLFETFDDLTIPAGQLGNEKDTFGNYLYTVDAVHGYTVDGEILGSSNGTPDQRFMLGYSPVIYSSVAILVNEGDGFTPWARVDTFLDSTPTSLHYKLEMTENDEAIVIFGNGISGKIPNPFISGILATYRVGGGEIGNVAANKLTLLDSPIENVAGTFNPDIPYEKGLNKETLESIKNSVPNSFRTRWACLTIEDYAARVKEIFPQVLLSGAEVNSTDVDTVNVYITLQNNVPVTEELRVEIMDMFDARKLIGTSVNLVPANSSTFIPITFSANIIVKDRYSQNATKEEIKTMFASLFELGSYDYGEECALSDLEAMILNDVVGVKSVRLTSSSSISGAGDSIISPPVSQILTLDKVLFSITGGVADLDPNDPDII